MLTQKHFVFILYVLMNFLLPIQAQAFKVSPIELHFSSKGRNTVQTILVENTTEEKVPVEIFAYDRVHVEGKEKRVRTRDFYFFPKQFILNPGEKRNIRLSWMGIRPKKEPSDRKLRMQRGNTNITQEKSYRLEVRQVPVDLKKNKARKTGITFLYNYVASLYVTPGRGKPNFQVVSYKRLNSEQIEFDIRNIGTAHDILVHYNVLTKEKKPKIIEIKNQKDEVQGINLLAGERRKIVLNVPNNLKKGDFKFEIKKKK